MSTKMFEKLTSVLVTISLTLTALLTLGCGNIGPQKLLGLPQIVYVMDLTTREKKIVLEDTWGEVKCVKLNPAGSKVCYIDRDGLYTINLDGTEKQKIFSSFLVHCMEWSPDSSKVAAVVSKGFGSELYVIDVDGTSSQLVATVESKNILDPLWSSNMKKVVLSSTSEICVYSIEGITLESKIKGGFPTIFNDKVCFVSDEAIYIGDLDGSVNAKIANTGAWPKWSPNGEKIMYVSGEAFWIMGSDGSNKNRIINIYDDRKINRTCIWLPDGTKAIYSTWYQSGELYIIDLINKTQEYLVSGKCPSLSPDGNKLVFLW